MVEVGTGSRQLTSHGVTCARARTRYLVELTRCARTRARLHPVCPSVRPLPPFRSVHVRYLVANLVTPLCTHMRTYMRTRLCPPATVPC